VERGRPARSRRASRPTTVAGRDGQRLRAGRPRSTIIVRHDDCRHRRSCRCRHCRANDPRPAREGGAGAMNEQPPNPPAAPSPPRGGGEGKAREYLRARSAQLDHELPGDCLEEARKIAEALIADGERPWIGLIRDQRGNFFGPLHPSRFAGRNAFTYTTHYVCCAGDMAYDPMIGEPVPVSEVAERLFGRPLPVEDVTTASSLRDVCAPSSTPRAEPHPSTSS